MKERNSIEISRAARCSWMIQELKREEHESEYGAYEGFYLPPHDAVASSPRHV